MRVLVLGGDGYLGWPTALHLSRAGYEVAVADNFARRGYDLEMAVEQLTLLWANSLGLTQDASQRPRAVGATRSLR